MSHNKKWSQPRVTSRIQCNAPDTLSLSLSLSPSLSSFLSLSLSLSHCLQLPPANLFEKPFVTFGLALFTLGAPVCPPVWLLDMYRHVDIVHTTI